MNVAKYMPLLLCFLLVGCGYSVGPSSDHFVLAEKYRTMGIAEVDNPTMFTWLEPRLRKLLRDEMTNRGVITWVDDREDADALISIDIESYTRRTAVEGENDETLRSSAKLEFSAVVRSAVDDSVLWSSGRISQSWPFFSGQESEADEEVTRLGIRDLANRMSQNY
ncbi:MAG: hypothetical protein CL942_02340 [Desulfovibrio sp.]|nr:hypothetical protein [Desulfovibrio sp.]|tara:strand:+ start:22564 stop:23061 length:498 start_codon:yes stop_codon:yes gene_type:complete